MRKGCAMSLQCKRIHDPVLDTDGKRILVDRDMPTDLNREEATLNSWYRDVAPSKELYDWYDQDPAK